MIQWFFSKFTKLCNHCHSSFRRTFPSISRCFNNFPVWRWTCSNRCWAAEWEAVPTAVAASLPALGDSEKQSYAASVLLCLACLTEHNVSKEHVSELCSLIKLNNTLFVYTLHFVFIHFGFITFVVWFSSFQIYTDNLLPFLLTQKTSAKQMIASAFK